MLSAAADVCVSVCKCVCVCVCVPLRSGEHCGGCRRSNSTERPHAFQVILTDRAPLELSAENEQDMAEWMQLLCQSVSKGVRIAGAPPAPSPSVSSYYICALKTFVSCFFDELCGASAMIFT